MKSKSFLYYSVVSGVCILLHNFVIIIADLFGCPLPFSVLLSYSIVVIVGFVLHSLLSFHQAIGLSAFVRYALAMSANIPLTLAATWMWNGLIGLPMIWAAPLATACMILVNFSLSRWAIAGRRRAEVRPWSI